jgi:RNA polymerase sigma-70 factor (ECF subfamily)
MDSGHASGSTDDAAVQNAPEFVAGRSADARRVEQLVSKHRSALVGHVRRILGRAEDAEDVVQDMCIRLLRLQDFWRGERQVRAFLFKIATNLARDELRRRRACAYGAHFPYETAELVSEGQQPEEIVERHLAMEAIRRALRILPPRYRTVFALHVDAHMSYRAISKQLGISTKTVERDICGARDFCRYRLGARGPTVSWSVYSHPDRRAALAQTGST